LVWAVSTQPWLDTPATPTLIETFVPHVPQDSIFIRG